MEMVSQDIHQNVWKRLAECRQAYEGTTTPAQDKMLLENTMSALQDLLELKNINWRGN